MKTLKVKQFVGSREMIAAQQCIDYVKSHSLTKDDIQQIVHEQFFVFLYYWAEEE